MNQVRTFITATSLLFASFVCADTQTSDLNQEGGLEAELLSTFVSEVEPFLREYPPQFRDEDHYRTVVSAIQSVVSELTGVFHRGVDYPVTMLIDAAQVFSMGHNLNLGTDLKAKGLFSQALAIEPENRRGKRGNYLFGMFLVSTRAWHAESQLFLEKAYSLGEDDAAYSLGLLHLRAGRREKGFALLEEYAENHPNKSRIHEVIEVLKDGSLSFQEHDS